MIRIGSLVVPAKSIRFAEYHESDDRTYIQLDSGSVQLKGDFTQDVKEKCSPKVAHRCEPKIPVMNAKEAEGARVEKLMRQGEEL